MVEKKGLTTLGIDGLPTGIEKAFFIGPFRVSIPMLPVGEAFFL